MNALKKYKERQNQAKAREIVDENLDGFIEHMDLLILYVLHAEFGFGKERLTRFFCAISDYYRYFRDRFVKPGDENRFWAKEKRLDTFALKQYLLECGFDYDAICEKKLQENKEMKKENEQ